jgi:hypothetical protein
MAQGEKHQTHQGPQAQGIVERANQTLGAYLVSWSEQKYGVKTRWPELVAPTCELVNTSWNRITRFTPKEVLQGRADNERVIQTIRSEGKKRKATTLYTDQPLTPGDYVRVSMRADGPAKIKGQIKSGTRKVGSEHQWVTDRGEANIRRVKRRLSDTSYELEDGTRWDRADLLQVPRTCTVT